MREHLRVNGTLTRSTVYVNPAAGAGLFYEEEVAGSVLKRRHYISGTDGTVVQITRQAGVADQERYWHKDHLGFTVVPDGCGSAWSRDRSGAAVADSAGFVVSGIGIYWPSVAIRVRHRQRRYGAQMPWECARGGLTRSDTVVDDPAWVSQRK